MNRRIKMIREEANLTQDKFAERIGIGKSSVSKLEIGTNNPSEQTIRDICEKFNVNREWLETGEGSMYAQISDDDFTVVNKAMLKGNPNKIKLFRLIAEMPDDLLNAMVKYFQSKRKDLP